MRVPFSGPFGRAERFDPARAAISAQRGRQYPKDPVCARLTVAKSWASPEMGSPFATPGLTALLGRR